MNLEDSHLKTFFQYIFIHEKIDPRLRAIFHVANERKYFGWQGKSFKDKGVRPGVPDVIVPIPNKTYPGLMLEFKIKPNKLTDTQNNFCALLHGLGYCVRVAWSASDAIDILNKYLDNKPC